MSAPHGTARDRILARLRADPPPASATQIAEELSLTPNTVHVGITRMLKRGIITTSDLPWRAGRTYTPGRPNAQTAKKRSIAEKVDAIVDDGDSDRVAALRLLWDINTQTGATVSPLIPNDTDGVLRALTQQLRAAGADLARRALHAAFPPEAPIAQETENLAPTAPGGDSMV